MADVIETMTNAPKSQLTALLDDWCRCIESGDPDRIASLYDAKATVAYRRACLQGRSELDDVLHFQRRKLQHLRVAATEVEHESPQRLQFILTLVGPFGVATISNDWTVQDGRIRDHSLRLLVLDRSARASLAA